MHLVNKRGLSLDVGNEGLGLLGLLRCFLEGIDEALVQVRHFPSSLQTKGGSFRPDVVDKDCAVYREPMRDRSILFTDFIQKFVEIWCYTRFRCGPSATFS